MPANSKWARWIFASIADYFRSLAEAESLPLLVEGLDDRTPVFQEATDRAELRISGPFSREFTEGNFQLIVAINVLVTSRYDDSKNRLAVLDKIGAIHSAMDRSIPVYRFGTGTGDDGSLLGCLSPRQSRSQNVRVLHFGQIDATDRLKQSEVDATYTIDINERD